jgi:glycosyltransferase involved in cell wall biosynthesis
MRASDVHVYLTVPFVLSWSLLDAMSTGCLIVASDTAPVREFLEDRVTGLLVPPHDPGALAARIETALDAGPGLDALRARARAKVTGELDARRVIWPRKLAWLEAALASPGPEPRPRRR